jgi:hypothetical protein
MFEQELKDFIAAEVVAGRLINADLTGINEAAFTGEAIGYIMNVETNKVDEKYLYFNKENGIIVYHELNKLATTAPVA